MGAVQITPTNPRVPCPLGSGLMDQGGGRRGYHHGDDYRQGASGGSGNDYGQKARYGDGENGGARHDSGGSWRRN